jgi:hypothetical protein
MSHSCIYDLNDFTDTNGVIRSRKYTNGLQDNDFTDTIGVIRSRKYTNGL